MQRHFPRLLDGMIGLMVGTAFLVGLTGGWSFRLGSTVVRQHSNGVLWLLALVALGLRYRVEPRSPGVPLQQGIWQLSRITSWVGDWLLASKTDRLRNLILALVGVTLLIKLANAGLHPGFFSGDDVEIHEMSLGHAKGANWPIWNLRSPFFPMMVIYPLQAVASLVGVRDVGALVFVGRTTVAVLSSLGLCLLYLAFVRREGRAVAAVAVSLLGTSAMYVVFGGMELPRVVGSLFVISAYLLLQAPSGDGRVLAAGTALAIAACFRFSEAILVIPAMVQLIVERRWRAGVILAISFTALAFTIQCLGDSLYWGQAFYSLSAALKFTLFDRLSSRGYQSALFYVSNLPGWTDALVVALCGFAVGFTNWRLLLWCAVPIVALSALPHKEPRYLLPLLPLVTLLAAKGLFTCLEVLRTLERPRRDLIGAALALSVAFRVSGEMTKYHIGRTDKEVAVAQLLAYRFPTGNVLLEEPWRFGGHLYFGTQQRVNAIAAGDLADPATQHLASSARLIVLSDQACAAASCQETLARLDFSVIGHYDGDAASYTAFAKQ